MEVTAIPVAETLPRVPVLVYHKIDPQFEYGITRVPPRRFARHLDWLAAHGYQTVHIRDVLRAASGHTALPLRPVVIAFDDGFDSVYSRAFPLLETRDMTATVFPVVGYAGRENGWDVHIGGRRFRHLSWDQMQTLRDAGWEIGSHTLNHPDLTRLPDRQIRYELEASRRLIHQKLGVTVDGLSCPFGQYTPRIAHLAAQAGYTAAVVVRNRRAPYRINGVVTLPAICVYGTTGLRGLRRKAEMRPPSWFYTAVERGIGWCARRTAIVKGPPVYAAP